MDVLVLENDADIAQALSEVIQDMGHSVEKFYSCADVLNRIEQQTFDLVLLDVFLPDGKGHHLVPRFKELWPDIWIVTMTGHNTPELEAEVRKQGIVYYMAKPFEAEVIREILNHIAKKRKGGGR